MVKNIKRVTPNNSTNPTPNNTPFTSPFTSPNRRTNIVSPQLNNNNIYTTPLRHTPTLRLTTPNPMNNSRRRERSPPSPPSPPRKKTRRNTNNTNNTNNSNIRKPPSRRKRGGQNKKTSKNPVLLPKLRKIDDSNKRYKYKLSNSTTLRKKAINEGIRSEVKKMNKTQRQAAVSKKGRFNILRIYRRNNNKEQCKKITKDMRYIDKKYGLKKTRDICGGTKKKRSASDQEYLKEKKEKVMERQYLCRTFGLYNSPERDPRNKIPAYCYKNDLHGVKEFQNKFKESIENEGEFKDAEEAGLTFGGKK